MCWFTVCRFTVCNSGLHYGNYSSNPRPLFSDSSMVTSHRGVGLDPSPPISWLPSWSLAWLLPHSWPACVTLRRAGLQTARSMQGNVFKNESEYVYRVTWKVDQNDSMRDIWTVAFIKITAVQSFTKVFILFKSTFSALLSFSGTNKSIRVLSECLSWLQASILTRSAVQFTRQVSWHVALFCEAHSVHYYQLQLPGQQ